MGTPFLDNLKKAVETGEFNSEAAKKIIEIDKLADEKKNALGLVTDRIEKSGFAKSVSEEEAAVLNSDYEKQLALIKKQDEENKRIADLTNLVDTQLATLVEIESMVKLSIEDMLLFADELEGRFQLEFKAENPMFGELSQKIKQIKSKYNSIINN
jgi:hypothetical protein